MNWQLTTIVGVSILFPVLVSFAGKPTQAGDAKSLPEIPALTTPKGIEIVVDKSDRALYLIKDGQQYDYPVALGSSDRPTPTGKFQVQFKQKYYEVPGGEQRNDWMLAFKSDGQGNYYAIHGGGVDKWTWGCVGVNDDIAAYLAAIAPEGTPIEIRE